MKKFEIEYPIECTVLDYCRAYVEAENEEQAVKYLKDWDWDHIIDTEVDDTEYIEDYGICKIDKVKEVEEW